MFFRIPLGSWPDRPIGGLVAAVSRGAAAALLAVAIILPSCGKAKTNSTTPVSEVAVNHSVPAWIIGKWRAIRVMEGINAEAEDMIMTVTAEKIEYTYPGCSVSGKLIMDKATPLFAANYYTLIMDNVNCPQQWEIPTFVGQEDYGKIWAWDDPEEMYMFRSSDKFADPFWVYVKLWIK